MSFFVPLMQTPSDGAGGRDVAATFAQRESLIQTLLGILNSAASYGLGPSAADFTGHRKSYGYSSPSPDIGLHIRKKHM